MRFSQRGRLPPARREPSAEETTNMGLSSHYPRLVGDIGGTHARFARVHGPTSGAREVARYRCADFATLGDALQRYQDEHPGAAARACALGVATPIDGDRVRLTNSNWSFSIRELQRCLGVERLLVLNDFTALALALPALVPAELRQVGGGKPVTRAPMALIGPGTGLGVSGLLPLPHGQGHVAIGGEGGHVTLAACDDEEEAVLACLERQFGHASAERALSGPGLENLYRCVHEVAGYVPPPRAAHEIARAALDGSDCASVDALTIFCSLLGQVAGNLALTLGARGGVYIGGGIVPQLGEWFDHSPFRQRFEAKGRFASYLAAIPVFVVQSEVSPALIGASRALDLMAA
jgi:glucokinase